MTIWKAITMKTIKMISDYQGLVERGMNRQSTEDFFYWFMTWTLFLCYCYLVTKSCLTLLQPHGLKPSELLYPWAFLGKNTGVGCHLLLQGIILIQDQTHVSYFCIGRWVLYHFCHLGSPLCIYRYFNLFW